MILNSSNFLLETFKYPTKTNKIPFISTSFIQHKGKILILKRSNKVGSFQGRYAAVSGYIELSENRRQLSKEIIKAAALKQAYIEIKEEINLDKEDVQLLKKGEMFLAQDETNPQKKWYIFPFLFELITTPKKIRLNWENSSYKWVDPKDLVLYKTVPQLRIVYEKLSGFKA